MTVVFFLCVVRLGGLCRFRVLGERRWLEILWVLYLSGVADSGGVVSSNIPKVDI